MFDPESGPREEEVPPQEEIKDGILRESLGRRVQGVMNESRLPSEGYESTVGVYGGKMVFDEEGRMVWDRTGMVSRIDKAGDAVLRSYDEHVVKEPGKLLKRHPKIAIEKFFHPGTKRYRGNNAEVVANIERLGLSEYYGPHKNGIEIKNPEIYTRGVVLQDVYRADLIKAEQLGQIDRSQALQEAAKYIRKIHDEHGGVGEILVSDIIFQENQDGKLGKPVLNLPDIVWNEKKSTGEIDKKATDLLDFLSSIFGEERRRSQDPVETDRAIDTVLANYGDRDVVAMVESYIKRGRLTLQGDRESSSLPETATKKGRSIFSQHNKARLGSKTEFEGEMKEKIKQACKRFLLQK